MSEAKNNMVDNLSKFQIACWPGHRLSEHLFVLKSVMALNQKKGKGILATSYDLKSFWDWKMFSMFY